MTDERASLFRSLGARRSSDRIADVISRTIFDGRFRPGDHLPTERALAQRFQVTRNTVREALRQLEQLRMVSIRQGSGVVVRDLLASAGIDLVALLLGSEAGDGKLVRDVLEVRAVVGRAISELAISRIDGPDLDRLRAAVQAFEAEAARRVPDPAALTSLDFEVHTALIGGSGNVALILLFNSLRTVTERMPRLLESLVARPSRIAAAYRRTLTALEAGDRIGAVRAFVSVFGGTTHRTSPRSRSTRGR